MVSDYSKKLVKPLLYVVKPLLYGTKYLIPLAQVGMASREIYEAAKVLGEFQRPSLLTIFSMRQRLLA